MLPGNAAYSKPKRPKEFLKAMNGEIRVYFPAYAPGPNLAEAGGSRSEKQRGTPPTGARKKRKNPSERCRGEEIPGVKTLDYLARGPRARTSAGLVHNSAKARGFTAAGSRQGQDQAPLLPRRSQPCPRQSDVASSIFCRMEPKTELPLAYATEITYSSPSAPAL